MKIWDVWRAVKIKLGLEAESIEAIEKQFPSQDLLMLQSSGK